MVPSCLCFQCNCLSGSRGAHTELQRGHECHRRHLVACKKAFPREALKCFAKWPSVRFPRDLFGMYVNYPSSTEIVPQVTWIAPH